MTWNWYLVGAVVYFFFTLWMLIVFIMERSTGRHVDEQEDRLQANRVIGAGALFAMFPVWPIGLALLGYLLGRSLARSIRSAWKATR